MKQTHSTRTGSQYSTDSHASTALGSLAAALVLGGLLVVSSYLQVTVGVVFGLALVLLYERAKRTFAAYRDRFAATRRTDGDGRTGRTGRTTHR